MLTKRKLARRQFLVLSAGAMAGAILTACGGTPTATPVPPTATKPPAAAPPTATTAAPAAAPTATKPPAVAPTTAPAPAKYKEAPILADLVKQSKLPPVEQRLPPNPFVRTVARKIGKYGGIGYGEGTSPESGNDVQLFNHTALYEFSVDLNTMTPKLAESFKFNADATSCTVSIRKGVKWSDGKPWTTDDIVFYFDDMQFNTEYTPVLSGTWKAGGQPIKVKKIDDYSIQFDFAVPLPSFQLIYYSGGPWVAWRQKTYFMNLHPKYNPNADAQAKAEGFVGWAAKFQKFATLWWNNGEMQPGVPALDPWVTTSVSTTQQIYERNPFYMEVDTEGNQLPYIDKWIVELTRDMEVFNARVISGNLTVAGSNVLMVNYPLLKANAQKGNYSIVMTYGELGADVCVQFNQIHPNPVLGEVFRDVRFRRAMSVAINRKEVNDLVFLGLGTERQATINSSAKLYQKKWGDSYAQYDPKLANQLLDQMGLDKKGPDGVRLMKDGKPLAFALEYRNELGPKKEVCELVVKHWQAVGAKVEPQERQSAFLQQRLNAQQQDVSGWQVDRALERIMWCGGWGNSKLGPGGNSAATYANEWKNWLNSGGKTGVEPPQDIKDLAALWDKWQSAVFDSAEYKDLGTKVFDNIAEWLYVIGVIGQGPQPVVVSNKVENVFTDDEISGKSKYWWGSASWYLCPTHAEQWFFKDA
jgi:peptide/nickel transport system substrate-binding protein